MAVAEPIHLLLPNPDGDTIGLFGEALKIAWSVWYGPSHQTRPDHIGHCFRRTYRSYSNQNLQQLS